MTERRSSFYFSIGFLIALLFALATAPAWAQPKLNAQAAIVIDTTGRVVVAKNPDTVRPIASISKLLVGSVMIEKLPTATGNPFLEVERVSITGAERDLMFGLLPRHDRKVKRGNSFTPEELLHISLISSNNITTSALALELGLDDIIHETNERLHRQGLTTVQIAEPTGLSRANVASARDLAAFGMSVTYTDLARISTTPQYTVGKVTFNSTNAFTRLPDWNVLVQKTGYTRPAGRCMLLVLEVNHAVYSIVLLGATSQQAIWRDVVAIRKFLGDTGFTEPRVGPVRAKSRRVNKR